MKFIHLGDLHLGKSLSDFDLIDDQKYMLDKILEVALERNVDAIMIAGDIYDKSIPSEAAVNLFDSFIKDVVDRNIKLYVVTGNHDSDERLNFGSSLFEANNVFISAKYDGTLHKYTIPEDSGDVNVYLMPFIKGSQVRHFYPDAEITNYDQAVRVAIENSEVKADECNVLIAHQFVGGTGCDLKLSGSENPAVQNVGLVEIIGYDSFDAFDYVALGHIHSAQRVGRDEVRYCGSPLKYSLKEADNTKSITVVEVKAGAKPVIEEVAIKPLRDLRHIRGKMKELLNSDNLCNTNDFIYVTLTDEEMANDTMSIFQNYYPYTVRVDYDNSHTQNIEQIDIAQIDENLTFDELITNFYRQVYGCDISEDEMKLMKEIAKEAGVADEAD